MPSVEYDMGDLASLLGHAYDVDFLRQKIPMMGVDLEDITEQTISVEIFPNRPDMLNVEGFARALKGYLGKEEGLPDYSFEKSDVVVNIDPSVADVRPYAVAACAYNIELDDYTVKSVMDMQEKLHLTHGRNRVKVAVGVHDLDKVKPPFTYKAVEPKSVSFVPLDMAEPLNLLQILQRHPKGRDYAFTLEEKDKYPLFVDSAGEVLSFPPIINGELTRLTQSSRNLFIEMTGTDQNALNKALNIVCTSLSDRGAKVRTAEVINLQK